MKKTKKSKNFLTKRKISQKINKRQKSKRQKSCKRQKSKRQKSKRQKSKRQKLKHIHKVGRKQLHRSKRRCRFSRRKVPQHQLSQFKSDKSLLGLLENLPSLLEPYRAFSS